MQLVVFYGIEFRTPIPDDKQRNIYKNLSTKNTFVVVGDRNSEFDSINDKPKTHYLRFMPKTHHYSAVIKWTGNKGTGTSGYRDYGREHLIHIENKTTLEGSSDPAFRGDPSKHNPEDMLVSSLSTCHMLTYLHLCAVNNIVVTKYEDEATGIMEETPGGGGHFTEVTLHPKVWLTEESMKAKAKELHHQANKLCFIANSVNFSVKHESEEFV